MHGEKYFFKLTNKTTTTIIAVNSRGQHATTKLCPNWWVEIAYSTAHWTTHSVGRYRKWEYKADFKNSLLLCHIPIHVLCVTHSISGSYYCACISIFSAAATLADLCSSNGPVIDIATAPIGAVTTIAKTATVNSCHTHTPDTYKINRGNS